MQTIVVNKNEDKNLLLKDFSSLAVKVDEGANLSLKLFNLQPKEDVLINVEVERDANFEIVCADFSNRSLNFGIKINLVGSGAKAVSYLASLSLGKSKKKFDVSFEHNAPNTHMNMENYGVAKDNSTLTFLGIDTIKKGMIKSTSSQSTKIIVFDEKAHGETLPILKIDENDVMASHSAIVGRLNDDHLFYLMSRGLTIKEAKSVITYGYLSPISRFFEEKEREEISKLISKTI